MLNALMEAINQKDARLPKYLVVVIDQNLLEDLDMDDNDILQIIPIIVNWFVRQINTIIRRKCIALLEGKPWAISGCHTHIIFVCMLRRIGKFGHRQTTVNALRSKFNDALNNLVAKISEYILTINVCFSYEHYDHTGALSEAGKIEFFQELDDLIHRFDLDKIKLLPNPKNPANTNKWKAQKLGRQTTRRNHGDYGYRNDDRSWTNDRIHARSRPDVQINQHRAHRPHGYYEEWDEYDSYTTNDATH